MYLVGLTGGMGSGKSTVATRLADLGADVIDADAIAREIVEPGEPALAALVDRFGEAILRDDGQLDRSALAAVAFADERSRADLNRLTHPHVAARIAARIAELGADGKPGRIAVVDHPLLIETGQTGRFDAVVVVLAPVELRVQRLRDARGLEKADIEARLRAQTDDTTRRAAATHVIDNTGSREELLTRTDAIHERLLEAARSSTR
ncbi:MAG: dephospho-CoA kinase [Actinomycetota bacterium]